MANNYAAEEWKDFVDEYEAGEIAEELEDCAASELIEAMENIPDEYLKESGLDKFSSKEELLSCRDRLIDIAAYFAGLTVSSSTRYDNGFMVLEYHMPALEMFGACILIDLMATLHHVTCGLPMRVELFVTKDCGEEAAETIAEMADIFDDVVRVDFFLEDGDEIAN